MNILFTTTDQVTSRLIRGVTGEPVSHVAVKVGQFVIQSNFSGVCIEPVSQFIQKNRVVYSIPMLTDTHRLGLTLHKYHGRPYDFPALFYLGLRYMLPSIMPKQNLWNNTGMFICTEFITELVSEEQDSMITPYQLFLRLKKAVNDGELK